MGNLATPEALLQRWEEMQRDSSLQDLPYKIELNAWGKVEMSPASVTECPVLTDIGIRVPDLAWGSAEFMRQHSGMSPLPTRAYLAAGAQEVWLAYEDGRIRFIDRTGEKPGSAFPISVSLPDLTKSYP